MFGFGALGLVLVLLIALALWRMHERRRVHRLLTEQVCKACGAPFSDTITEVLGRPGAEVRQRLDRFQRRFARYLVRCCDCGAVNVVTKDGIPYRAFFEQ